MKAVFTHALIFLLFHVSFSRQATVDSLLLELGRAQSDSSKMNLCIDISWELANSNSKSAMQYAQQALKLANQLKSSYGLCYSYNAIAAIYSNTGDFNQALTYYKKAMEAAGNDKRGKAVMLTNIGNVYSDMGKTEQALGSYYASLKLHEEEKDEKGMQICYENLALTMETLGNFNEAKKFFAKSVAIGLKRMDEKALSGSYINIGNMMKRMSQFDSARSFYLKGLSMAEKIGHERWKANALSGLGMVETEMKQYGEALKYYQQALVIHRDNINDQLGVAHVYHNMAALYQAQGDLGNAIATTHRSLEISRSIGAAHVSMSCLNNLSQLYALKKEYENAYDYHVKYLTLKDSLSTIEGAKQIAEMQTKYETEKKENEIRGLTQKNEIQNLQLNRNRVILYAALAGLVLLTFLAITVYKRYQLKQKANAQLELQNSQIRQQKSIIEEKNKDITDSIVYAKRIQEAILPPLETMRRILPDSFVLYKPKDIVSGDFYYFSQTGEGSAVLAAVDCTGHGVPGAFMSIVGHNILNQAIVEFGLREPGAVLNKANELLVSSLSSSGREKSVKDGMDISLCHIDFTKNSLEYAGAYNPLWIIRRNELIEIKADKIALGSPDAVYRNNVMELQKGDRIYLFSDGYADQFGGSSGKKFKYKNMKDLLLQARDKSMEEQQEVLNNTFEEWRGELEQVDDILVMGIRFS